MINGAGLVRAARSSCTGRCLQLTRGRPQEQVSKHKRSPVQKGPKNGDRSLSIGSAARARWTDMRQCRHMCAGAQQLPVAAHVPAIHAVPGFASRAFSQPCSGIQRPAYLRPLDTG